MSVPPARRLTLKGPQGGAVRSATSHSVPWVSSYEQSADVEARWLTPRVRGIGGASLLADLGQETNWCLIGALLLFPWVEVNA